MSPLAVVGILGNFRLLLHLHHQPSALPLPPQPILSLSSSPALILAQALPSSQPKFQPHPTITSCISRCIMENVMLFPHADVTCENTESPLPGAWKCTFLKAKMMLVGTEN